MSRPKGSTNKQANSPAVYTLSPDERLQLIAGLLVDIIYEELCAKT
jgi:hypothetical protein